MAGKCLNYGNIIALSPFLSRYPDSAAPPNPNPNLQYRFHHRQEKTTATRTQNAFNYPVGASSHNALLGWPFTTSTRGPISWYTCYEFYGKRLHVFLPFTTMTSTRASEHCLFSLFSSWVKDIPKAVRITRPLSEMRSNT